MNIKKVAVTLLCVLLLGFSLVGCGSSEQTQKDSNSAQPAGELKIGVSGPLSGPSISWGYGILHGAELAADDINAKGGLDINGKKYTVKIIGYDDLYTGQGGVTAVNRLLSEDKVKYIIGPVGSAPALAIEPIIKQAKVISMNSAYANKAITKDTPYTFRVFPTTGEMAGPMDKWIASQNPQAKKVAILAPKDDTGIQAAKDVGSAWQTAGLTVSASELYDRSIQDFVPILTRILAQGVDVIDTSGSAPATTGLIVKQASQLGFKGIMVKTGGPGLANILKVAGDSAEGFYFYSPANPDAAAGKALVEKYNAKYKDPMNEMTPFWYDATMMLVQAMQTAGTIEDSEAVKNKLEAITDFPGVVGTLNWSGIEKYGISHQIVAPVYVGQVKAGKPVYAKAE